MLSFHGHDWQSWVSDGYPPPLQPQHQLPACSPPNPQMRERSSERVSFFLFRDRVAYPPIGRAGARRAAARLDDVAGRVRRSAADGPGRREPARATARISVCADAALNTGISHCYVRIASTHDQDLSEFTKHGPEVEHATCGVTHALEAREKWCNDGVESATPRQTCSSPSSSHQWCRCPGRTARPRTRYRRRIDGRPGGYSCHRGTALMPLSPGNRIEGGLAVVADGGGGSALMLCYRKPLNARGFTMGKEYIRLICNARM